MRTIRQNTFETNSSSAHSLTVDTNYKGEGDHKNMLVEMGEFGWEYQKYNSPQDKASWLWTIAQDDDHRLKNIMEDLAEKHGWILDYKTEGFTYVDHGMEHFIDIFGENYTEKDIESFIIENKNWLMTGNDNSIDPPGARLTPNQIATAPIIIELEGYDLVMPVLKEEDIKDKLEDLVRLKNEKGRGRAAFDSPYMDIDEINPDHVIVKFEQYDCKKGKYELVRKEKWNYKITRRKQKQ